MPHANRVVVKVGSSLLTNPDLLTPRWAFIQRLLEDIALLRGEGYEVVLCSSGSVALGMNMMGLTPDKAGLQDKQASAACGMPLLINAYKQVAQEYNFDIAQILVTLGDFEEHRRFLNAKNTLHRLLMAGIMPVVNENDTVTTDEVRVGDNDRLAAKVAQMVQAQHLVILTGVDGLYDRDPSEEGAILVEEVHDVSEYLEVTTGISTLGSGGMLTKLQAANMAQNAGCTTWIANGEVEFPASSALKGERKCTKCPALSEPASAWAAWLTDRLQMAGSVVIKNSAVDGVCSGEHGVRRADVLEIRGDYSKGDVIHVYDEDGEERARGLTNFTSEEAHVLIGNPDLSAQQLLGYQTRAVLIEPNNLVALETHHLPWASPTDSISS